MVAFFVKYYFNFTAYPHFTQLKSNYKELQEKFGQNLRRIRIEKGLSLRELAANCDLYDGKISKIENGQYNVQLSTVFELAKGLGIEAKSLLEF